MFLDFLLITISPKLYTSSCKSSKLGSKKERIHAAINANPLFLCSISAVCYPAHFIFCILKTNMSVCIQCDTNICTTHNVLQRFGVHAALFYVATKRMTATMRRDFRHLLPIDFGKLCPNSAKTIRPVLPGQRHTLSIQIEKSAFAIHNLCNFRCWSESYYLAKIGPNII